ncbi:MAG: copper chaperone PCu(A)C [Burkholderiales bacterium]
MLLAPAAALAHGPGAFKVENPRALVGAAQAQVYVTLVNKEAKSLKIVGAISPSAERAELRRGARAVPAFDIPGKGTLELAPGGNSIVLLKLTRALGEGDLVPVILRLDDGDTFAVMARVVR